MTTFNNRIGTNSLKFPRLSCRLTTLFWSDCMLWRKNPVLCHVWLENRVIVLWLKEKVLPLSVSFFSSINMLRCNCKCFTSSPKQQEFWFSSSLLSEPLATAASSAIQPTFCSSLLIAVSSTSCINGCGTCVPDGLLLTI